MVIRSFRALAGVALLGAVGVMLGGCGSSESFAVDNRPMTEVPASAGASVAAYTGFAGSLRNSDTDEPLGLNLVPTAPVSETAEPSSI